MSAMSPPSDWLPVVLDLPAKIEAAARTEIKGLPRRSTARSSRRGEHLEICISEARRARAALADSPEGASGC